MVRFELEKTSELLQSDHVYINPKHVSAIACGNSYTHKDEKLHISTTLYMGCGVTFGVKGSIDEVEKKLND